jgi:hypothetical protein
MALEVSGRSEGLGVFDGRSLELDLAFDVVDGELPVDPEADWEGFKATIGRRVATQVADRAVPLIIWQLGAGHSAPTEFRVRTSNHIDNDWEIDPAGVKRFNMRQHMTGKFRLETLGDGDMKFGNLIFAARDLIAAAVAESAVFTLEQRFEGKQTSDTDMEIARVNGEITGYKRTKVLKDGGEDQPASTPSRLH